jgi:predicted nucleotidyltransferase
MVPEPDLTRYADFLAFLDAQHAADPDLRAAWLGGSAATGGYDDHSDLDVEVLCAPGTYLEVYERILAGTRDRFSPAGVWELPASTYADGRQFFAALDPSPGRLDTPTRIVDVVVWDSTDEHRRVDVRRHGNPLVRFDPDRLVVLEHDDARAMRTTMEDTLDQVGQRRLVAEWLVNRAIARNHLPEAVALYLRLGLTPVVQLLRARHCPERHDYGLRYLHTDLPPADVTRIEGLLPGVERLRALSEECFAWQDELLQPDSSAV